MYKIVFTLCLCFLSLTVQAEQPLSKPLIENYTKCMSAFSTIVESSPALENKMSEAMALGKDSIVETIQASPLSGKLQSLVKEAGFNDLEEFIGVSYRIMGSVFAVQMQKPESSGLNEYIQMLETQLANIDSQGMPKALVESSKERIESQLNGMKGMQKAAKYASEEDIAFVSQHYSWVEEMMSADDNS